MSRLELVQSSLPHYERPPLVEVVFTLRLRTNTSFKMPHVGLFWSRIQGEFPQMETQAPLASAGREVPIDASGIPWTRSWFISADGARLLQVQQDRLIFNWRNHDSTRPYPRFTQLRQEANKWFGAFEAFWRDVGFDHLIIDVAELAYVNHLRPGVDYPEDETVAAALPFLRFPSSDGFLGSPSQLVWGGRFDLPNEQGQLRLQTSHGTTRTTGQVVYVLELASTSKPGEYTIQTIQSWLDVAHEAIVRTFADVTDKRTQSEAWRKV